MEYRVLGATGLKVSALSLGASPLGSIFEKIDENVGIQAVHTALDLGINLIDVSPYYGLTKAETVLGRALKTVKRDRYYLTTKVGRYGAEAALFDFSADRVKKSVDESLARLGVDYVDVIQCHDVEFGSLDQVVNETIPALRQVIAAGKARYVGITGLPLKIFKYVLDKTKIDTILSYCRYSLNDTALDGFLDYLEQRHVGVISASPLSMGLFSDRGPPSWHPAPADVKAACAAAAALCKQRGGDIAQLAVNFALANKRIATTLVGTASPENITKNVRWIDAPIDQQLLADVKKILAPIHNKTWLSGRPENNDPGVVG